MNILNRKKWKTGPQINIKYWSSWPNIEIDSVQVIKILEMLMFSDQASPVIALRLVQQLIQTISSA